MNYDFSRVKVLIVDDNPHMRKLLKTLIEVLGTSEIFEAENGEAAIKLMRWHVPDLIFVDWKMDKMNGIEFTKYVRMSSDSPNPYIPIIMLTGHSDAQRVCEARDAGVNEVLAKPVSAKSIFAKVAAVIERPRPFVRTRSYFGPCRRRLMDNIYHGTERRGGAMSQASVEQLTEAANRIKALTQKNQQLVDDSPMKISLGA